MDYKHLFIDISSLNDMYAWDPKHPFRFKGMFPDNDCHHDPDIFRTF